MQEHMRESITAEFADICIRVPATEIDRVKSAFSKILGWPVFLDFPHFPNSQLFSLLAHFVSTFLTANTTVFLGRFPTEKLSCLNI